MFNATRFALARKRRGINKRQLAQRIGVSEKSVIAYEKGAQIPERGTLNRIALALGFPAEFFLGEDIEELTPDAASFRALAKMTASQRDMALAAGGVALLLSEWIERRFALPAPELPDLGRELGVQAFGREEIDLSEELAFPGRGKEHEPEAAAESLRRAWGLGEMPVGNMLALVESKGIRVFSLALDAKEIDAFSMWHGDKPFMFLNALKSAERCRFDAAHELGHLVMHRHGAPTGQEIEREANAFASAFLMPRRSVLARAPRAPTLPTLIEQKKYWTVSVAALNYRLHALGLTSAWTYRTLCMQIAESGYRTREPEGAPHETSWMLAQAFSALREEGIAKRDIARALNLPAAEIEQLTFGAMPNAEGDAERAAPVERDGRARLEVVK
jgi:Zn-dependent peptidase ImmA (M78 family)/transcriptional regulator with XRE-family HTH domain